MVDIENYIAAGGGGEFRQRRPPAAQPQTFYFKMPPNEKLLGYWDTVADRLFKLRHCQNIAGASRSIWRCSTRRSTPGCWSRRRRPASTWGACSATSAPRGPATGSRPSTRRRSTSATRSARTAPPCSPRCNRRTRPRSRSSSPGSSSRSRRRTASILQAQIDAAAQDLAALDQALALAQAQQDFAHNRPWANPYEAVALSLKGTLAAYNLAVSIGYMLAGGLSLVPDFALGVAGFGGTPTTTGTDGGTNISAAAQRGSDAGKAIAIALDKGSDATKMAGDFQERSDQNAEKDKEAQIQVSQVEAQIVASQIRHQIAVQQLANHQNQLDRLQQQIDFLTGMFTSEDLYDWMIGKLSATYFQSYRLAYKLCQQAERCYRYELGLTGSSFIQFGYWDSLKKGLQAGRVTGSRPAAHAGLLPRAERPAARDQPLRVAGRTRSQGPAHADRTRGMRLRPT